MGGKKIEFAILLRKEGKWGGQIFINLPLLIENLLNINKDCSNILV